MERSWRGEVEITVKVLSHVQRHEVFAAGSSSGLSVLKPAAFY